jgi:acetoin:2,6-dichlorophenolindophenol oxidoreductase subunit alpha
MTAAAPTVDREVAPEQLVDAYRTICRIRLFEDRCVGLARAGELPGPVHPYIGQEAIAASVALVKQPGDYFASYHRGHGHCIAAGARLDRMMAEIMGKETGYCRGRGGSMHICDFENGMLGANGIVGGGIGLAGGAALAASIRAQPSVAFCFLSDGASNQGLFHETANMAAIWKLPLVLVVENNQYALSVPVTYSTSVERISDRAAGYAMPGVTVDGSDVIETLGALQAAVQRARAGEGPSIVEARTNPWDAHSSVSGQHKFDDVSRSWRDSDPMERTRALLLERGILTDDGVAGIEADARDEVEEAVEFGRASDEPSIEAVEEDVYA